MDDHESPRRPSLSHERTVLMIIALVVASGLGWLGWQAQIVRHRQAVRKEIEASGGKVDMYIINVGGVRGLPEIRAADTACGVPWLRRLLGDQDFALISFERQLTTADREAIEAFPEAIVFGIPDAPPDPIAP